MVKKFKDLVSIIIRGKNESRWLKILLKELNLQTYKNFEIIFCDNISKDNTLEILKRYKVKKVIKIKKYLPGDALNKAVEKCKGKYIAILSSHCIPLNKFWLSDYINYFQKNIEIVAGFGKQLPLPGTSYQNLIDLDIIFKNQEIIYKKDPYLNNANSFFRAEILKKNKFNSKITNIEDKVWAKKICDKGFKISYTAKSTVFHIHGIHQHETRSRRAETTYKIVEKQYRNVWDKCNFLKVNYHNLCLILDGRSITNKNQFSKKIKRILSNSFIKKLNLKKIIVLSNFNMSDKNKTIYFKSKNHLKSDLIKIYQKYYYLWKDINYNIYFKISEKIDFLKLKKIINKAVYNNYESLTLADHIKENFIVKFTDQNVIKNIEINKKENQPSIFILNWSKGIIFDPDYLRKGILFSSEGSNIEYK